MTGTRKIAAILVADVVGYSRLTGADEDRTLARLRTLRSDLIDPTIAVHNGRSVKRTGDGSLIEFRSVVDAVRCALEVQSGMAERNSGLPTDKRIEFRVGIHLGDVVEESDGDLMGDGVNIAARLEGVAKPGGVCLSEDAWRQLQGKVEARFVDAGEQSLKNISRPMRTFHWTSEPSTAAEPARLRLIWRLAEALGVGRKRHDSTRASLSWKPALLAVLILLAVVGSWAELRLWPETEQRKPARAQTRNLEAYDNYLRAENEGYYNIDGKAPARAMAFYGKAIELDPNFADAQAGYAMAAVQVFRNGIDYLMSSAVARKRAYDAAGRALDLDPNNGRAYVALAVLQLSDGRHADSIASARRAVSLDPNDPELLANLGMILAYAGQPDEAVGATQQALGLSPSPPPGLRQLAGIVFYNIRKYDRAIKELKAVIAVWPASVDAHEHLAAAYAQTGELDLARSEARLLRDSPLGLSENLTFAKLWYEPYYKRAEDLNHYLDGLKTAGVPQWPFGFEGRPQDRITGQALSDLAIGPVWTGYAPVPLSGNVPFFLQIDRENRIVYRSAHALLRGVARVENDQICAQFDGYLPNFWLCGGVYRTVATLGNPRADYVYVLPDGLKYFSVKE